jgi:hypothetical protein
VLPALLMARVANSGDPRSQAEQIQFESKYAKTLSIWESRGILVSKSLANKKLVIQENGVVANSIVLENGFWGKFVPSEDGIRLFCEERSGDANASSLAKVWVVKLGHDLGESYPIEFPRDFRKQENMKVVDILASNTDGSKLAVTLARRVRSGSMNVVVREIAVFDLGTGRFRGIFERENNKGTEENKGTHLKNER